MEDNNVESVLQLLEKGDASANAHIQLIRAMNWQQYSIGPMSSWPRELSTIIYLVMVAPQPQCLLIGKENVLLYNAAYGKMVRSLHPGIMGQPLDTIKEWQGYGAKMASHRRNAALVPTYSCPSFVIPMMNNGRLENVHLQLDVSALPPSLQGFHLCFEETTDCDLRERRRSTVRELSEIWSSASDLPSLWPIVLKSLVENPEDFPIAAIYSTRRLPESRGHQERAGRPRYYLEGSVGDFDDSTFAPYFDLDTTNPSLQPLRQAVSFKSQVTINNLPDEWSKGSLQRGTRDLCTEAAVLPSSLTRYQDVEALLVIGLPTRALLDEPHQQHIKHLQREFADVVNNLVATTEAAYKRKEDARRNQLEKDLLAKELALRQQEAELATTLAEKVLSVIDQVDIGFFEYKSTGELIRANECYYRLSGYPRDSPPDKKHKFLDLIHPDDVNLVSNSWKSMIGGQWQKFELRYRNDTEEGQWALAACQPVKDRNGVVTSVIGAVTDISTQKRSEKIALDRAEALEQARASEERFKRCMDIAPVGCMIADTTKGVQYVNETWWQLSQHARVPLDQIDWNTVLHEEDLDIAEEGWQAMRRGEQVTYSLRLKRLWYDSDGQPRGPAEVMVTALPECDDTGKVIRVLGFTIDVSHFKFQARMQRVRMEEALEARKNQESFYDTVSHELRNPLSAVIHCADSINDSLIEMRKLIKNLACKMKDPLTLEDEIKTLLNHITSSNESVETIATCSDHQRRLISDILSLSKLDSQLLQINPSPVHAVTLLQDVRKMFGIEAGRLGITLEIATHPSIDQLKVDKVNLDSGRILQVLINLVGNAIKFSKNEPGPGRIRVVMGASEKRPLDLPVDFSFHNQESIYESSSEGQNEFYLWFTVSDAGRGMAPDEKARIFTRFAQGSRKTYSEYGGSGLGLFISRQLVELQQGEIGVSSELGKGSTFAFFINAPLVLEIEEAGSCPSLNSCHTSKADSAIHVVMSDVTGSSEKIKLLVVEDNILNQRVLKKQLIKHGYEVHVANNGQEALDFLTSPTQMIQVDCVLLDIEMPIMCGLTAAKRIREWERRNSTTSNSSSVSRPRLSRGSSFNSVKSTCSSTIEDNSYNRLPIIAISANARPEQTNDAIMAGMDDSIAKPFRIADLIPRIDHLLDKRTGSART
ncbi:hypothetical protein M438DRAFT_368568 [Aureobasidium pullulans EXF-150]|uniref:histidine kinase n=1 Tax=Aureobasidium pullulans EXF-150 TaxID=1043002 RepID=A0A074XA00_AURPU|nr:uncharacterized protein M438DRAFT_368568 [Aureobasidium pullulans EXF-150]KEQ80554.1 hypothetical protein M438DRAFT_368568 [Aureobasidium pullulans EXF-150]